MIIGTIKNTANAQTISSLLTDEFQLSVYRQHTADFQTSQLLLPQSDSEQLYQTNLSSIKFVNNAGQYCGFTDGYVRFTAGKWNKSPFLKNETSSSSLLSPIIRTVTFANPLFDPPPSAVNDSQVMYYYTIPFASARQFNRYSAYELYLNPNLTNTIPQCIYYEGDDQETTCQNCEIDTFSSYEVTYACYDIEEICSRSTSYLEEEEELENQRNRRRSLFSLSGDDDQSLLTTPKATTQQVVAITATTFYTFVAISSVNPFQVNVEESIPVVVFVGCLFILFICGSIYFLRNPESTQIKINYQNQSNKKAAAVVASSSSSRRSSSSSSSRRGKETVKGEESHRLPKRRYSTLKKTPSQVISEKYLSLYQATTLLDNGQDNNNNNNTTTLITENLNDFRSLLAKAFPLTFRRSKNNSFWHDIIVEIGRFHPLFSLLLYPSTIDNRHIRFLKLFSDITACLFVDTLFFGLFYNEVNSCTATTALECNQKMNPATGSKLCTFIPNSAIPLVNTNSSSGSSSSSSSTSGTIQ